MTIKTMPVAAAVVPVSFTFSPADVGWVTLTVTAGDQGKEISLSYAFDPFVDLVDWATSLIHGHLGSVEIDQEGSEVHLWVNREPGRYLGHLRVFEPAYDGPPVTVFIDATVDIPQVALAFHDAFTRYVVSYDPDQWDLTGIENEPRIRTLALIDTSFLTHTLGSLGLIAGKTVSKGMRTAYETELGSRALPIAA